MLYYRESDLERCAYRAHGGVAGHAAKNARDMYPFGGYRHGHERFNFWFVLVGLLFSER